MCVCILARVCVCLHVTENNEYSDRYMNDAQYTAQRERRDEGCQEVVGIKGKRGRKGG